jgi:hypothetical protein
LTEYFLNEENVDECWKADQQLFRMLYDTQIYVPAGVSERLNKTLTVLPSTTTHENKFSNKCIMTKKNVHKTSPCPLQRGISAYYPPLEGAGGGRIPSTVPFETSLLPIPRKRTLFYWIGSAVAIALLCIGLFFIPREPSTSKIADTFTDPEEAAWVAAQTLAYVSSQLNKGLDKVTDVEQEIEKISQLVNKHLNK